MGRGKGEYVVAGGGGWGGGGGGGGAGSALNLFSIMGGGVWDSNVFFFKISYLPSYTNQIQGRPILKNPCTFEYRNRSQCNHFLTVSIVVLI